MERPAEGKVTASERIARGGRNLSCRWKSGLPVGTEPQLPLETGRLLINTGKASPKG